MSQPNKPSKKKITFPVSERLLTYLTQYGRCVHLPVQYDDLTNYESSLPLYNQDWEETLWETVVYAEADRRRIHDALTRIYSLLKTDGDTTVIEHLSVSRVDYCTFGNTKPFRVRIINRLNDNYDHFYVKRADASRVYGLELEELLSPNSVMYLYDKDTLIEEHIAGIPGDDFIRNNLNDTPFNQIRIAKEFVKFNERCFVRLLGDMRAYNYVVDITPDIEGSQFRLRAIDFDQQSYEGRSSFYQPKYFKENNPIIFVGKQHMSVPNMMQYQLEERSLIAARIRASRERVTKLFKILVKDTISTPEKVAELRRELGYHHKSNVFDNCETMGQIVLKNLKLVLDKEFRQSSISFGDGDDYEVE